MAETDHITESGKMAETEWVLVPREPTAEMRTAALETAAKYNRGHSEDHIKALALDSQSIYRAMLSASPKPPHQEEGAAGLAERLSDWRARGVSGEDADAAASALLSQASQIEALRKERDAAREMLKPFADAVFNDNGDMTVNLSAAQSEDFIRAYFFNRRSFLDANGGGHAE